MSKFPRISKSVGFIYFGVDDPSPYFGKQTVFWQTHRILANTARTYVGFTGASIRFVLIVLLKSIDKILQLNSY